MLSTHPEVQHFVEEEETNYEMDENMNKFCIFITEHKTEYDRQTL